MFSSREATILFMSLLCLTLTTTKKEVKTKTSLEVETTVKQGQEYPENCPKTPHPVGKLIWHHDNQRKM